MNHLATVTSLHGCHEAHTSVSSFSISQQQNCWFNHHPSEQYPILISDSHSVTMDINPAFNPMHTPAQELISELRKDTCIGSPTRLTTNHVCPGSTTFRNCDHNHRRVISPWGPR